MIKTEEKTKWIKRFRTISIMEGISFLLLLFVAMPLKYTMDLPMAVTVMGWIHGVFFVIYIYVIFPTAKKLKWNFRKTFFGLAASILPFGPFIFDRNLRREEKAMAES